MEVHCFPAGARSAPCGSPPFPGEGRLPLLLGGTTPGLPSNAKDKRRKKKHSLLHRAQPSHAGEFIFLLLVLKQRAPNTEHSFSDRASTRIFEKWRGRRRWQSTKFPIDAFAFFIQRLILLKAGSGAQPRPNLNDNLVSKVIPVL